MDIALKLHGLSPLAPHTVFIADQRVHPKIEDIILSNASKL